MLKIGFAGVVLVALCSIARADAFDCKATETQAECHARLKCKPDEEVQACQKRLRAAAGNTGGGDRGDDRGGDDRGGNDRGGDDRGGDRGGDDRGGDRGGDDRGGGRGDRGDDGRRGGGRGRGRRGGGGGGGGFEANKTFGIGLELGEPSGINGKYFVGPSTAIDFGVGYIYRHYYYERGEGLHLYADLLFHPVVLARNPTFELPLYVGPGLRYWDFAWCDGNNCTFRGSAIGVRVPVGLSFDFNNVPLDIFIQLVPTIDFVSGPYYDRFDRRNHFGVDFSAGIRFWPK
jgi:hypothetical protein